MIDFFVKSIFGEIFEVAADIFLLEHKDARENHEPPLKIPYGQS